MFKIVGIGGRVRAKEFILEEGDNIFGKSVDCQHRVMVEGVSRNHMNFHVQGEIVTIEDLRSANGTLVNDELIKRQVLKNGDVIAIPNAIFQLVHVKEKNKIIHKKVAKHTDSDDSREKFIGDERNDFFGKLIVFFQKKVMSTFYSFNEKYEWSAMVGFCLACMIACIVILTISPVLRSSRALLKQELVQRAVQYANEVKRLNYTALARRDFDKLNTGFLEREKEIESYELFDQEGRIIAPLSKNNTMIQDEFSINTRNSVVRDSMQDRDSEEFQKLGYFKKDLPGGQIGIGVPIYATDLQTGQTVVKGAIALKFRPASLLIQAKREMGSYLEAFATSLGIGVLFFAIIYFLTIRHLTNFQYQVEQVSSGKQREIEKVLLFEEMGPVVLSVNNALARLHELNADGLSDFAQVEESGPYIERLKEFLEGAQGPALILDADKNVKYVNSEGEDLIGVREAASKDAGLIDCVRDQGLAATILDLCDKSANDFGGHQRDYTPISGRDYVINVASMMGKDNFAKAHYITFMLDS